MGGWVGLEWGGWLGGCLPFLLLLLLRGVGVLGCSCFMERGGRQACVGRRRRRRQRRRRQRKDWGLGRAAAAVAIVVKDRVGLSCSCCGWVGGWVGGLTWEDTRVAAVPCPCDVSGLGHMHVGCVGKANGWPCALALPFSLAVHSRRQEGHDGASGHAWLSKVKRTLALLHECTRREP